MTLHETHGDGRRMQLAWETFGELFEKMKREAADGLCAAVRARTSENSIVMATMRIEALQAIEERVMQVIKRGHRAGAKLAENGEM